MQSPKRANLRKKSNLRLGEKLRALRLSRRWSQAELAASLGLSRSRLSEIELGAGSLTAEQFIEVLKLFNVSLDHFTRLPSSDPDAELQNALARLGANHLHTFDQPPGDRFADVNAAIRGTLLSGSPRLVAALAPVLVHSAGRVALPRVDAALRDTGLDRRLPWLVANVLTALRGQLDRALSRSLAQTYRRATVVLEAFQDSTAARAIDGTASWDVLDETIRSAKTLADVRATASPIAQRWRIATRLRPEDFADALRAAHAGA